MRKHRDLVRSFEPFGSATLRVLTAYTEFAPSANSHNQKQVLAQELLRLEVLSLNREFEMDLLAKQVMQRNVHTIAPDVSLPELERAFVDQRVSGFPVVDKGKLVGIVSRSDIVRQLVLEHHLAERTSDFYFDGAAGFHETPLVTFDQVSDRVGERIEQLKVKDVMSRGLFRVSPNQPLKVVAQILLDNRVHRVLVTDNDHLLGLVSSLDLVGLIANGRLKADQETA